MNSLNEQQQQDFRHILAWLRGGDITPDPDMEEKFLDTITGLVKERLNPEFSAPVEEPKAQDTQRKRAPLYGNRPHPLSLKALMQEVTGDPNYELPKVEVSTASVESNTSDDADRETADSGILDSVVLARSLVYLSNINAHPINMTQIQAILYIVYGGYLASKGKRLTDEHPQMWEYGPVFPKVYNKLKKQPSDGKEEAEKLQKDYPQIWGYLSDSFSRNAWTSGSTLVYPHLAKGTPWAVTRKSNPDKWGAVIEDSLIERWFKERI